MEELKRAHELRVYEFSRTRLIENQDTNNELMAKIQELHNEVNCMNDSREFKDAESARSGHLSHVPSQPPLFPLPAERNEPGTPCFAGAPLHVTKKLMKWKREQCQKGKKMKKK